jgi:hypothetical protein
MGASNRPANSTVVVFGGYGTFGSRIARELAHSPGFHLVIAGRNAERARSFANSLGTSHSGRFADVADPDSCRSALDGADMAIHAAGPFRPGEWGPLQASMERRCPYIDIAEHRAYVAGLRQFDSPLRERGGVAVFGASSLPGISGALAVQLRSQLGVSIPRMRITLFIGNRNPKGAGAVGAFLAGLGEPISAPQGRLLGFRDREVVPLPPPFGPRAAFNFDSPEYDLFPQLVGARSVTVKAGFELRTATYALAAVAAFCPGLKRPLGGVMQSLGDSLGFLGCSGGAVMVEAFLEDGRTRRRTLLAREDGQRMAIMPCVLAARTLAAGGVYARGTVTAYDAIGADRLVNGMADAGFAVIDA